MKNKQSRGILYLLLIVGVFTIGFFAVFVGCSKSDFETAQETNNTIISKTSQIKQLRFLGRWVHGGKKIKLIKNFLREYEFKNQDVAIKFEFAENLANGLGLSVEFLGDLLIKDNSEWDVVPLANYQGVANYLHDSLWAKKYMVDFSQFPEFRNNTIPKLLTDNVKAQWGGIIPGPFLEGAYMAMWTNKNVTNKLGIEVKTTGMTFDDFLSYIRAVDAYNKNNPNDYIIPIDQAGNWKTSFIFAFHLYASALNNSKELFNTQVTEDKLNAWHKTLKALEKISKLHPYKQGWKDVSFNKSSNDLLYERCLFFTIGSGMYNPWEKEDAKKVLNIYPAELPVFNKINLYPLTYLVTWGVPKNAANRDEAVKLLLAMNKPDMADRWVMNTKCPTGIKGRMTDLTFGFDQFENFANHIQKYYGDSIYASSNELAIYINGNSQVDYTYYSEVLDGELSADEAMKLMKSKLGL